MFGKARVSADFANSPGNFRNRRANAHVSISHDIEGAGQTIEPLKEKSNMPRTISNRNRLTLLAGACALSLAFAPNALAAGGGGGMGGGHMGGTMTSPAPFHDLNNPPSPQPGSTSENSHAPQIVTNPSRSQPVTGTRIPPVVT